ncbi:hypothetical protein CDAR_63831 [Caerostris darwini]|uniref:Uncharacterized protein n=1 Tax=Caerostris darwini TaxID=1538125 RepID=A0AAV4QY64_9ARAC|nr:hypothetical protein CDAR_63831 [Caerostris darwini]
MDRAPILSLPGIAHSPSGKKKKAAVHRPRAALLGQLIQRKRAGDAPSPNRDCLCGHLFALGRTKQEMGLQGRSGEPLYGMLGNRAAGKRMDRSYWLHFRLYLAVGTC